MTVAATTANGRQTFDFMLRAFDALESANWGSAILLNSQPTLKEYMTKVNNGSSPLKASSASASAMYPLLLPKQEASSLLAFIEVAYENQRYKKKLLLRTCPESECFSAENLTSNDLCGEWSDMFNHMIGTKETTRLPPGWKWSSNKWTPAYSTWEYLKDWKLSNSNSTEFKGFLVSHPQANTLPLSFNKSTSYFPGAMLRRRLWIRARVRNLDSLFASVSEATQQAIDSAAEDDESDDDNKLSSNDYLFQAIEIVRKAENSSKSSVESNLASYEKAIELLLINYKRM